jgi:hypothetical protein
MARVGVSGGIVTISAGQGRPRRLRSAARPHRQQRQGPEGHKFLSERVGLSLFASDLVTEGWLVRWRHS